MSSGKFRRTSRIFVACVLGATAMTFGACSSPTGEACESNSDCQPGYECVSTGGVAFGDSICLLGEASPADAADTVSDTMSDAVSDTMSDTVPDTMLDARDAALDGADADVGPDTDTCDPNCLVDSDGDGIVDAEDGCPQRANPHQRDRNSDGVQDACEPTISINFADAVFAGPIRACCAGVYPWQVAGGGDLTGDGRDDFVIAGHQAGSFNLWVIDGTSAPTGTVDLSTAVATLELPQEGDLGLQLGSPGDVNGDGVDDLLVGQPGWQADMGRALLFLGGSHLQGDLSIRGPDGEYHERIADRVGFRVDIAPDVNGDGYDDMVIGEAYGGASSEHGRVHIIFGDLNPPDRVLLTVGSGADVRLLGINNERAGWALDGVGDINGDGLGDLIVGAPGASAGAGAVYVVYGDDTWANSEFDIVDVGVQLSPVDTRSTTGFGSVVSSAGDVDGDGALDFLIGEPLATSSGGIGEVGAVHVVFGGDALDRTNGPLPINEHALRLEGAIERARAGSALAALGDLDGDGYDDVLIGAPLEDGHDANSRMTGAVHLLYGYAESAQRTGETLELDSLSRRYLGPGKESSLGFSVSTAGDIDGDGRPDLLMSMSGRDDAEDRHGAAFLVYGQ